MVTEVAKYSEAEEMGVKTKDIIQQVDRKDVTTPAEVEQIIAAARKNKKKFITMLVARNFDNRFVTLSLDEKSQGK